jgi:hypothetical protein
MPAGKPAPATTPQPLAWNPDSPLGKIFAKYTAAERILAVADLVRHTPVAELPGLIDQAAFCPSDYMRDMTVDLAYGQWAALDPAGAFAHSHIASTRENDPKQVTNVLTVWASHDPETALNAALSLESVKFRSTSIDQVLLVWAQGSTPAAALAAAQNLPQDMRPKDIYERIYDRWSRHDPAAAMAALDQIETDAVYQRAQNLIIRNMANTDPSAALATLHSLPDDQRASSVYGDIFSKWGKQDPAAAVAALPSLGEDGLPAAFTNLTQSWAKLDPDAALDFTFTLPESDLTKAAMTNSLTVLSRSDPAKAWATVRDLPDGSTRDNLIRQVGLTWGERDPQAALKATFDLIEQAR